MGRLGKDSARDQSRDGVPSGRQGLPTCRGLGPRGRAGKSRRGYSTGTEQERTRTTARTGQAARREPLGQLASFFVSLFSGTGTIAVTAEEVDGAGALEALGSTVTLDGERASPPCDPVLKLSNPPLTLGTLIVSNPCLAFRRIL